MYMLKINFQKNSFINQFITYKKLISFSVLKIEVINCDNEDLSMTY